MKLEAYAKINLGLKVVGDSSDGYHLLDMVMLPISLCDYIEINKREDEIINVEVTNGVPLPLENSMTKAIKLMQETYNFKNGFDIKIEKNIPMQAGMGGGTSDAACILKVVNEIMNINASLKELEPLAMKIGADVVYSLYSKLSRVQGKGEQVTLIDKKFEYPILIVKPKTGIKTKECFELYNKEEDNIPLDIIDNLVNSIDKNILITRKYSKNSLVKPAKKLAPIINKIIREMYDENIDLIQMSGSGSTVFCIDRDINKLEILKDKIKENYHFVGLYKTL